MKMVFGKRAACVLIVTASIFGMSVSNAYDADGGCTNASFEGTFGFTLHGDLVGAGPTNAIGVITADGKGGLHGGKETAHINGVVYNIDFPTGTYSMDSNCMATGVLSPVFEDGTESHGTVSFVLTSPDEFQIITTTPGRVLSGVGKRITVKQ